MLYDYSNLMRKVEDVFESLEAFGMAMDWSHVTTRKKFNNESKWIIGEIHKATKLLNIPAADCSSYFFTLKDAEVKKDTKGMHNTAQEVALLFDGLPVKRQDEILALMRQMRQTVAQDEQRVI